MENRKIYTLIEAYFQEKNRAWLHADFEKLMRYHTNIETDLHLREITAYHKLSQERGVKTKKVSTDVSVLSSTWDDTNEQATVHVKERLQWIYRDGLEYEDEERVYEHVLHIQPHYFNHPIIHCSTVLESNTHQQTAESNSFTYDPSNFAIDLDSYDDAWYTSGLRDYYNRIQAMKYAETWWDRYNPAYRKFEVDCTNFVSQCVRAGNAPMVHVGNRAKGWWYRHKGGANDSWSYSWAVAHSLRLFLAGKGRWHGEIVADPTQLKVGDVICYDWEGDGRWTHNTIVVAFDRFNRPLVNAHTVNSRMRYWEYKDSHAYTSNTKYLFFRIPDTF
jgi:Putative amidase domain